MRIPEGVETVSDAIQYIGMKPGDRVYMTKDCGDHWEGKSVTIPAGQPGILKEVFLEQNIWWMLRVDLENSPSRPYLTTSFTHADLWSLTRPPPPPPQTRYEHLLADILC